MASTELDPLFVKGLRLLRSKNKDSTEQLRQLYEDSVAQLKQSAQSKDRIYATVKMEGDSKIHIKKTSREISEPSSFSSKYSSEETRERKAEKRQSEKSKQDSVEVEAKIPKLEPPQVYSYYNSSPPDLPTLDQYVPKKDEESDSSDENADADDFAMEMGLACVICKSLDVTQGNQLIECQECHSLYHQECHKPPATDDYNDPRRVWYCAKCVKSMKKMATKTQKSAKSGVTASSKESVPQTKSTRSEGSPPAAILPFKRAELKTTLSQGNTQTAANKPIGLAGFAANFVSGKTLSSSSTTSLATATRGTKSATTGVNQKPHVPFSSTATSKTSSLISTSNPLSKITISSSAFQSSSSTSQSTTSSTSQKTSTTSTATKGLGLLSAAVAATANRNAASAPSGNGNNSHKVPSCSPLMSADKRLQIMKKKASKMQERRRLSNK